MTLPSAYSEEVVCPEHVVVTLDDDGAVHLLCYVGEHLPDKFMALKHVVLTGAHAAIVDTSRSEELDVASEASSADAPSDGVCGCGARLMPSGWCTFGHAPESERVVDAVRP